METILFPLQRTLKGGLAPKEDHDLVAQPTGPRGGGCSTIKSDCASKSELQQPALKGVLKAEKDYCGKVKHTIYGPRWCKGNTSPNKNTHSRCKGNIQEKRPNNDVTTRDLLPAQRSRKIKSHAESYTKVNKISTSTPTEARRSQRLVNVNVGGGSATASDPERSYIIRDALPFSGDHDDVDAEEDERLDEGAYLKARAPNTRTTRTEKKIDNKHKIFQMDNFQMDKIFRTGTASHERYSYQYADCLSEVTSLVVACCVLEATEIMDSTGFEYYVGRTLHIKGMTRPDISYAVGVLNTHAYGPTHMKAVKRIVTNQYHTRTYKFAYLHADNFHDPAVNQAGMYESVISPLKEEACKKPKTEPIRIYADADFAGDVSRRSTSGNVTFLYSAVEDTKDAVHMKVQLHGLRVRENRSLPVHEDNVACRIMTKTSIRNHTKAMPRGAKDRAFKRPPCFGVSNGLWAETQLKLFSKTRHYTTHFGALGDTIQESKNSDSSQEVPHWANQPHPLTKGRGVSNHNLTVSQSKN